MATNLLSEGFTKFRHILFDYTLFSPACEISPFLEITL